MRGNEGSPRFIEGKKGETAQGLYLLRNYASFVIFIVISLAPAARKPRPPPRSRPCPPIRDARLNPSIFLAYPAPIIFFHCFHQNPANRWIATRFARASVSFSRLGALPTFRRKSLPRVPMCCSASQLRPTSSWVASTLRGLPAIQTTTRSSTPLSST